MVQPPWKILVVSFKQVIQQLYFWYLPKGNENICSHKDMDDCSQHYSNGLQTGNNPDVQQKNKLLSRYNRIYSAIMNF